jgi:hypothetical protein
MAVDESGAKGTAGAFSREHPKIKIATPQQATAAFRTELIGPSCE